MRVSWSRFNMGSVSIVDLEGMRVRSGAKIHKMGVGGLAWRVFSVSRRSAS